MAANAFTADQHIAIVLPWRIFRGAFQQRGLAAVVGSNARNETGAPTLALILWNSCGAQMAALLNV
jgi:NhaC family Na+:H+ antiporter